MIETTKKISRFVNTTEHGVLKNTLVSEITVDKTRDELNAEAEAFLKDTDWKVIRHIDEQNAGIETSLTQEEYEALFQERQQARDLVVKL